LIVDDPFEECQRQQTHQEMVDAAISHIGEICIVSDKEEYKNSLTNQEIQDEIEYLFGVVVSTGEISDIRNSFIWLD